MPVANIDRRRDTAFDVNFVGGCSVVRTKSRIQCAGSVQIVTERRFYHNAAFGRDNSLRV